MLQTRIDFQDNKPSKNLYLLTKKRRANISKQMKIYRPRQPNLDYTTYTGIVHIRLRGSVLGHVQWIKDKAKMWSCLRLFYWHGSQNERNKNEDVFRSNLSFQGVFVIFACRCPTRQRIILTRFKMALAVIFRAPTLELILKMCTLLLEFPFQKGTCFRNWKGTSKNSTSKLFFSKLRWQNYLPNFDFDWESKVH